MKKIFTIEKEIVKYSNQNPQSNEAKAYREMLRFWEIYDEVFHDNKVLIISIAYADGRQSNVYKCLKAHIAENTFIRDRKHFLDCYQAILKRIKAQDG